MPGGANPRQANQKVDLLSARRGQDQRNQESESSQGVRADRRIRRTLWAPVVVMQGLPLEQFPCSRPLGLLCAVAPAFGGAPLWTLRSLAWGRVRPFGLLGRSAACPQSRKRIRRRDRACASDTRP